MIRRSSCSQSQTGRTTARGLQGAGSRDCSNYETDSATDWRPSHPYDASTPPHEPRINGMILAPDWAGRSPTDEGLSIKVGMLSNAVALSQFRCQHRCPP